MAEKTVAEVRAMLDRIPGKPSGNGDMAANLPRKAAAIDPHRSLINVLQDMAANDADDYAQLIESVRRFMAKKQDDLDRRHRLIGTK